MPHIPSPVQYKLQIYRKILIEEFIREFKFLVDVARDRAAPKADFTDKILKIIKLGGLGALESGAITITGVNIISAVVEMGADCINDKRKEGRSDHISEQAI